MKKVVMIFLLVIYGVTTMGATVYVHYCMNEFVGWSLLNGNDENCGKCGMEEKDNSGCCKDDQHHLKLKIDHQKAGVAQFISLAVTPFLPFPADGDNFYYSINFSEKFPNCHAPPLKGKNRLHVLYHVFLI